MLPFRLVARAAALAAWFGLPAAALGQTGAPPAPAPLIAGGSSCPAEAAVWTALGSVVARDRFDARLRALTVTSAPIEIGDLGASFRVIAAGRTRTYRDEARDCDERARVAALFIALAIDPDDALAPAPPVVAPPPPVAQPPAPQPAPGPPPLLRLEVGPALELGLLGGDGQLAWGGAVRVAVGRGKLAAVIGGEVTAPATPTIGGVRLRQWREPLLAGVRLRRGGRRVELDGELGGTAAVISERGIDLTTAATSTSVELGLYGAVAVRFASGSRLSPFVLARAEVVPGPAEIFDLPHGVVGHAPRLWLGLNAGVSLGFL